MLSPDHAQNLASISQDTTDAWNHFVSLFRRDCADEGREKSLALLPDVLQGINTQLTTICHSVYESEAAIKSEQSTLPHDSNTTTEGDFGFPSLVHNDTNNEPQDVKHHPQDVTFDAPEPRKGLPYAQMRKSARNSGNYPEGNTRSKVVGKRIQPFRERLVSSDGKVASQTSHVATQRKSRLKKMSKIDALEHWKQFEIKEKARISNSGANDISDQFSEHPVRNFEQLLTSQDGKGKAGREKRVSVEDAHAITRFISAVASPQALVEFRQALTGWRSLPMAMELVRDDGFASVLRALRLLEAQTAFTSIATRIKLVQLTRAVDSANRALPLRRGRGNPIFLWLSSQYKLFLRAEYPDLKEGTVAWNTKLDDLKRKVRAGRRWQQLIPQFGLGVIGLVPFELGGETRSCNFDKCMKTFSDNCFKLMVDMWEMSKGDHIRSLAAKLEEFMGNLFSGNSDLPMLVLENANLSEIESQPNCSPSLATYLGIAVYNPNLPPSHTASAPRLGYISQSSQSSILTRTSDRMLVNLVTTDEATRSHKSDTEELVLERLGLQFENLDEFTSPNKMSGAVVNAFMNMLQANADELVDGSLFLDSDFFSGINKCLNCRTQERHCDILEQGGAHCIHCRRDGVICERPRPSSKVDADSLYKYNRIFVPTFTKEITHWSLVVISTASENCIVHYDSLGYLGSERPPILRFALQEVVKWVKDLISPARWNSEGWKDSVYSDAIQPPGGNDCGICTVMFCYLLLTRKPIPSGPLAPSLMINLRYAFKEEIRRGKFRSHPLLLKDSSSN